MGKVKLDLIKLYGVFGHSDSDRYHTYALLPLSFK